MSRWCPHAAKIRALVCRLARCQRPPPPPQLPHPEGRSALSEKDVRESTPEPAPYNSALEIAKTWAQASKHWPTRTVARRLAEALENRKPIGVLIAEWTAAYAPWTICGRLKILKRLLRTIDASTGSTLARGFPKVHQPRARAVTATKEELERMMQHATPHLRLFIMLTNRLALRFAEALSAAPENYDPENRTLTLRTKGGFIREFHVTPEIAALIQAAPEAAPGGFVQKLYGGRTPLTKQSLYRHFKNLLKRAGVRPEINPHDLRRTAAIALYKETHDVLAVKKLLAHETVSATAHYLQPYDPENMTPLLREWHPNKGEKVQ